MPTFPPRFNDRPSFPQGLRVLVADGDSTSTGRLVEDMRRCKYKVSICNGGRDMLRRLQSNPLAADVVIVEVVNTGDDMDGFTLCSAISPYVAVLLISSTDASDLALRSIECGAAEFLQKPLPFEHLKGVWQHAVRKALFAPDVQQLRRVAKSMLDGSVVNVRTPATGVARAATTTTTTRPPTPPLHAEGPCHITYKHNSMSSGLIRHSEGCKLSPVKTEVPNSDQGICDDHESMLTEEVKEETQRLLDMLDGSGGAIMDEDDPGAWLDSKMGGFLGSPGLGVSLSFRELEESTSGIDYVDAKGACGASFCSRRAGARGLSAGGAVPKVENEGCGESAFASSMKLESSAKGAKGGKASLERSASSMGVSLKASAAAAAAAVGDGGVAGKRKVKVDWTPDLHEKFVKAVDTLGLEMAIPSRILELMGTSGLTRHNIASHLQKYRSHRKQLLARGSALPQQPSSAKSTSSPASALFGPAALAKGKSADGGVIVKVEGPGEDSMDSATVTAPRSLGKSAAPPTQWTARKKLAADVKQEAGTVANKAQGSAAPTGVVSGTSGTQVAGLAKPLVKTREAGIAAKAPVASEVDTGTPERVGVGNGIVRSGSGPTILLPPPQPVPGGVHVWGVPAAPPLNRAAENPKPSTLGAVVPAAPQAPQPPLPPPPPPRPQRMAWGHPAESSMPTTGTTGVVQSHQPSTNGKQRLPRLLPAQRAGNDMKKAPAGGSAAVGARSAHAPVPLPTPGVAAPLIGQGCFFGPSRDVINSVISEAMANPSQPPPLGLRPPSITGVLQELHVLGVQFTQAPQSVSTAS